MGFIKWDRPRGSVHNVAKALDLQSSEHCNVLLVSDAALYVIQNWVALDLEFKARWADEIFDHGYIPISEESVNYAAWVDLIEQIQGEAIDMSCEIVGALETLNTTMLSIKDSIDALATEQGGWDDLLTDLLLPLGEMATGADMLALSAAVRDQQLQCCDALADAPYYDPGLDTTTNPETSTFCQRADSLALNWQDAAGELWSKSKTISSVGLGLLSIIVAALNLPIAVLMAIVAVVLTGLTELSEEVYLGYFVDLRLVIRCAIWNAQDPQEAKVDIDAGIDAYESQLTSIEKTVLKYLVGSDALNQVFAETYPIRTDAVSDCSSCEEQLEGGCMDFDIGLGVYEDVEATSPVSWDDTVGHDAAGSILCTMLSGDDGSGADLYAFAGIIAHTGDVLSVWHYVDQSSSPLNCAYDIYFTDLSAVSDFDVRDVGGWYEGTYTVQAAQDGKEIDFIRVWIQKSLNGETRIAHIDDVCYTPA